MPELTVEEWRFVSVLLANDIARDRLLGLNILAERHQAIWEKIRPFCEWDEDE